MDEVTFLVLKHDCETKARLVHASYRSSRVDRITKNRVSKKRSCVAAVRLQVQR